MTALRVQLVVLKDGCCYAWTLFGSGQVESWRLVKSEWLCLCWSVRGTWSKLCDEGVVWHGQAANYLNIKNLLDLTCQTVADMIKGKTPEEIRKTFNIKNDFTPEEEEEVRRENQWAFE
jgi:hypothetical protein